MKIQQNSQLIAYLVTLFLLCVSQVQASEDEPLEIDKRVKATSEITNEADELEINSEDAVATQIESSITQDILNSQQPLSDNEQIEKLTTETTVQSETTESSNQPDPDVQPSLNLLGSAVEPGEAALLKWSLEATFVDNSTPVPVLVVNGVKPGPTLCLTAAVHGDELNGIEVVRRIVHELEPEKLSGAVIGVPIVNLQGFRRANRYLPDRRDLNRYFPGRENGSYASRIAHSFFTNVIQKCDYLVDLHTGSLSRTNLPQIRANLLIPEVASLAEKMGSIVVLPSKGSVGTLRRAAVEAGIPAVTLEAGAPNDLQKDAVEEGVKSVLSAMSSLGLAPKQFWKRSQEPVYYQSTWIRARHGGILFSKVELGDAVKKDSVLGLLSDPITNKTTEIIAPIEGRVIGMALNQVMYPGFAAYHIGLKSSAVEAAQPQELIPEEALEEINGDLSSDEGQIQIDINSAPVKALETDEKKNESEKQPLEDMALPTIDADE